MKCFSVKQLFKGKIWNYSVLAKANLISVTNPCYTPIHLYKHSIRVLFFKLILISTCCVYKQAFNKQMKSLNVKSIEDFMLLSLLQILMFHIC